MSQPLTYGRSPRLEAAVARRPRFWLWMLRNVLFAIPLLGAFVGIVLFLNSASGRSRPNVLQQGTFNIGSVLLSSVAAYAVVVGAILLLLFAAVQRSSRRRRARLVLDHVEFAVASNLPLPAMVYAAERSESGITRSRLRELRRRLLDGLPLQAALSLAVPELSMRELGTIGAAERSGTLPRELARLTQEPTDSITAPSTRASLLSFSAVVLFFIVVVGGMIGVFLLPKFDQIAKDFGVHFLATQRLLRWTIVPQFLVFPIAAAMFYFVLLSALTRLFRVPRRRAPLTRLRDTVGHFTPLLSGLLRDRAMADGCRVMAQAVAAGRPLPQAIGEAAQPHLSVIWQDRFERMSHHITLELAPAAVAAKLPRLFAQAVGFNGAGNGLSATLLWVSQYYEARDARRRAMIQSVAPIVITLLAGALVYVAASALMSDIARFNDAAIQAVGANS